MEFKNQKTQRTEHVDLSRKGSIDEPILDLVKYINSLPNYFTTSSCSGRVIIFESAIADEQDSSKENQSKTGKKGCKWLFTSHSKVNNSEIQESLCQVSANAVFKFEAMVMHVQCETLQDAQWMHQAAVASGFRNSGISVGAKGKIITAIRSTHGLEAPLSKDGVLLVTPEYCQFLVECANQKMEENLLRIQRFFGNVKLSPENGTGAPKQSKSKKPRNDGSSSQQNKQDNLGTRSLHSHTAEATPLNHKDDDLGLFMFENT